MTIVHIVCILPVMPTILKIYGFKLFFYSKEESRIHVHIKWEAEEIKIWMDDYTVAFRSNGFKEHMTSDAIELARKYEKEINSKWKKHFKIRE